MNVLDLKYIQKKERDKNEESVLHASSLIKMLTGSKDDAKVKSICNKSQLTEVVGSLSYGGVKSYACIEEGNVATLSQILMNDQKIKTKIQTLFTTLSPPLKVRDAAALEKVLRCVVSKKPSNLKDIVEEDDLSDLHLPSSSSAAAPASSTAPVTNVFNVNVNLNVNAIINVTIVFEEVMARIERYSDVNDIPDELIGELRKAITQVQNKNVKEDHSEEEEDYDCEDSLEDEGESDDAYDSEDLEDSEKSEESDEEEEDEDKERIIDPEGVIDPDYFTEERSRRRNLFTSKEALATYEETLTSEQKEEFDFDAEQKNLEKEYGWEAIPSPWSSVSLLKRKQRK